jgi:ribulose-phosphate 3-epimerase
MVRQAESFATYVQLDIMDGRFVPSRSISYQDLAAIPIRVAWEAHLMVLNPEGYFEGFRQAGAKRVVFHCEATDSPQRAVSRARSLGLGVGVALKPETPVSDILHLVDEVDSVLFLTVNPGFYGSEFIPGVLDKVADLRKAKPELEIGVDGGIKESNIGEVARLGVDIICVGSAIFKDPQPAESFRRLSARAEEGSRQWRH